jgi:hypothetical protein
MQRFFHGYRQNLDLDVAAFFNVFFHVQRRVAERRAPAAALTKASCIFSGDHDHACRGRRRLRRSL